MIVRVVWYANLLNDDTYRLADGLLRGHPSGQIEQGVHYIR